MIDHPASYPRRCLSVPLKEHVFLLESAKPKQEKNLNKKILKDQDSWVAQCYGEKEWSTPAGGEESHPGEAARKSSALPHGDVGTQGRAPRSQPPGL